MPGEQQQAADADELVGGQVVAVLAYQHAEQVLARVGLGAGDQLAHVGARLHLHRASAPSGAADTSSIRLVVRWKPSRSSYGTPSSSQITSDGIGSANDGTRSAGEPARSIASRCSSTMPVIRGSSRRIRRMVNSGVSIRRSRVCSGGSKASRLPARSSARSSSVSSDDAGQPDAALPGGAEPLGVAQHRAHVGVAGHQPGVDAERCADAPDPLLVPQRRQLRIGTEPARRMCSGSVEDSLM